MLGTTWKEGFSAVAGRPCISLASLTPSLITLPLAIPLPYWLPCWHLNTWNQHLPPILCSGSSLFQEHTSPGITLDALLSFLMSLQTTLCLQTLPEHSVQNNSYYYSLLYIWFYFLHNICHLLTYFLKYKFLYFNIIYLHSWNVETCFSASFFVLGTCWLSIHVSQRHERVSH